MSRTLQFQFDENQAHQLEAISSIVDLFDGLEKIETGFTLGEDIFPNLPEDDALDEDQLRDNLRAIQERSNFDRQEKGTLADGEVVYACSSPVTITPHLEVDDGFVLEGTGNDSWRTFHFTVEMETGTGKTYVYLRTIHELYRKYGFTKFIIVVPSVAIFEGVIKAYEVTKAHFASLYDNERPPIIRYDGNQIGRIRDFASNQDLTLMVMTRDSFNKSSNNFYKDTEKLQGELKPYQWVQLTRPIVILDEPQNMKTEKAKEAIRTLKPLFVLRYSATHVDTPNPVYRLTPVDAFRQNLVKQIQVIGLTQLGNLNVPVLQLLDVKRNPITARVRALKIQDGQTSEQEFPLKQGADLFKLTKHDPYKGYVVAEIKLGKEGEDPKVIFENGATVSFGEELVGDRQDVFRAQIEKTIETHLARQAELKRDGIKVLSLFFIDRVKNYTAQDGIIKRLFDNAFDRLKTEHSDFAGLKASEVREGYFAKPKADSPDEEAVDTDGSNQKQREMEKAAFELIMRKKEKLLSFHEPVSFIFAHSALKEGWDNPNVFQICTLNNTASTLKKRQEIGRGLRLAVDQSGKRADNHDVNVLTVIANESYESYVANLQKEYVDDGYGDGMPPPKKPEAAIAKRNDKLFSSKEFRDFWAKLNRRMRYEIQIDAEKLTRLCIERLNRAVFPDPVMVVTKGVFIIRDYTISLVEASEKQAKLRIRYEDTLGNQEDSTLAFPKGADLEKVKKDKNLRGFKITLIEPVGSKFRVKFDNGMQVTKDEPIRFQTERAAATQRSEQRVSDLNYPVFDIIGRVTSETNLTRRTVTEIFKGMKTEQKEKLFRNPEGWCGNFLAQIKGALCDHVADNIVFFPDEDDSDHYDAEELFGPTHKYPQSELIEAGKRGLYDKVQTDSDVERLFVNNQIRTDEKHTVLFFKFPPKFKIHFPKIIGNYNPDWGIVRRGEDGNLALQLVRETKGGLDFDQLQFPQEKRKIVCAQKHFKSMEVSYRVVTHQTTDWWEDETRDLFVTSLASSVDETK